MSEPTNENEAAEGGGGKSKLFLIIGLVVVLLVGGGAGYYFMFMNGAKDGDEKSEKKSKKKKKSKKSKQEPEEDDSEDEPSGSDADRSLAEALQDDEDVKQVVELQPFIVNLADVEEARYLRMTVSLGIGGEEGGHDPDPIFLAKVKNAMLAVLSVKKSEDVLTVKGKSKLRKQLLEAAQSADEDGHVEAIYITDFIVQL